MADKRIDELEAAASVTNNDLFVLEQAGTAKKLEAFTLETWLLQLAQGHGGITGIAKTSSTGTNPVVDTYTITFSDASTTTFNVTNGVKGDTGDQTYVYIKYSNRDPIADTDMTDTPSAWMGICATTDATAPTTHTSYSWYEIKGEKGDPGNDITISSTSVMYQAWTSGTQYPTGTWLANPPAVTPGNYLWTRTIVNYSDGGQTVSYSSARWGMDGSGAVGSVNSQLPDQDGNVTLTASDVGALPDSYQPPVTSVNNKTGTVVLDNIDVNAAYSLAVRAELSSTGWYRVLSFETNETLQQGSYAFDIDLSIKRSYNVSNNEMHKVSLLAIYQNIRFGEETSVSNQYLIQGIRYTRSSTKSYIDIRYASNSANNVDVDFTVHAITTMCANIKAESLQLVADAPTGETIVTNYVFAPNCISESKWLAWENSSPAAGFAAQTVSLDLSKYEYVDIEFSPYGDDTRKTVRCPVGKNCNLFFMFINTDTASDAVHSLGSTSRSASVTTSGITFGNGQMLYDGAVYQNWTNRSIPTKIWAIR